MRSSLPRYHVRYPRSSSRSETQLTRIIARDPILVIDGHASRRETSQPSASRTIATRNEALSFARRHGRAGVGAATTCARHRNQQWSITDSAPVTLWPNQQGLRSHGRTVRLANNAVCGWRADDHVLERGFVVPVEPRLDRPRTRRFSGAATAATAVWTAGQALSEFKYSLPASTVLLTNAPFTESARLPRERKPEGTSRSREATAERRESAHRTGRTAKSLR